jgi:hypothetical protein
MSCWNPQKTHPKSPNPKCFVNSWWLPHLQSSAIQIYHVVVWIHFCCWLMPNTIVCWIRFVSRVSCFKPSFILQNSPLIQTQPRTGGSYCWLNSYCIYTCFAMFDGFSKL